MNAQKQVYENVAARGYMEGYSDQELAARQIAKLAEELGEAAAHFFGLPDIGIKATIPTVGELISFVGDICGYVFDRTDQWKGCGVLPSEIENLKSELADIQVVLFCLSQSVARMTGEPFDVVQAALDKGKGDIERGVRK